MKLKTINECVELLKKKHGQLAKRELSLMAAARELEPEPGSSKEQKERYRGAMEKVHDVQCKVYEIEAMLDDLEGRDWK